MKVSRNELKDILGVSLEGLKTIEKRKQLNHRLISLGYNFISKEKISRKVYYYVENSNSNKQLIINMCKYVFNTRKNEEFVQYFKERTENSKNDIPTSLEYLSNKVNVGIMTVRKWDLKLLDKKIISKDGYFYFKMNKLTQTIEEVTKEEYNSYWRNNGRLRTQKKLQNRFMKGEIDFEELKELIGMEAIIRAELEGKYLLRIKRYKLNKSNLLYLDFLKLVQEEINED